MMAAPAMTRGAAHGLSWEYAVRPVDRRLAGLVTDLTGYAEHATGTVRRRQAPVAAVPVILSLGPAISVDGSALTSFAAGPHDRSAYTAFTGDQCGVELLLSPLGAYRLLGVPPGELANRSVPLPLLDHLAARAAELPDWAGRLDLVESALLRRAADGRAPDRAVAWAWDLLRRRAGSVQVSALAAEIGWSQRHFTVRFRAETGFAPKTAARVLRFERASALLVAGSPAASVAAACGYADQSHLVREFRALAGCTPGTFLAERDAGQVTAGQVTFVQDGAAVPV